MGSEISQTVHTETIFKKSGSVEQINSDSTVMDLGSKIPDLGFKIPILCFNPKNQSIQLYDRSEIKFLIRNLSPIPASFRLNVEKYGFKNSSVDDNNENFNENNHENESENDNDNDLDNISSENHSYNSIFEDGSSTLSIKKGRETVVRFSKAITTINGKHKKNQKTIQKKFSFPKENNEILLLPQENGKNKFYSKNGQNFINDRITKQENFQFLQSGLGCSFILEPNCGSLPPWGEQIINIKSYNDMPGFYNDKLICEIYENNGNFFNNYILPITMSVRGCPFSIVETSVGMSTQKIHNKSKRNKHDNNSNKDDSNKEKTIKKIIKTDYNNNINIINTENNENNLLNNEKHSSECNFSSSEPLLDMGHSIVNSDQVVREFHVRNAGSKVGLISWECSASYPDLDTDR